MWSHKYKLAVIARSDVMECDDSSTHCDLFQGSQLLLKRVDLLLLFLPIQLAASLLQNLCEK